MAYRVKTEIEGLRLAGASAAIHGVSGAAVSGLHAAASIMECKWTELLDPEGQELKIYPLRIKAPGLNGLMGKFENLLMGEA